jgi:hypothetical protein
MPAYDIFGSDALISPITYPLSEHWGIHDNDRRNSLPSAIDPLLYSAELISPRI